MKRRHFLPILGSGLLIPTVSARAAGSNKKTTEETLSPALEEILEKHKVPALAAGLFDFQGLRHSAAAGVRKAGTKVPVTTRDLWHMGSMTKAMTASLVAKFVEDGRLKWDSTLGEILPDDCQGTADGVRDITVAQLLHHRSGLPANLLSWMVIPRADQRIKLLGLAAPEGTAIQPGGFLYSNVGYVMAGRIVEKLGGEPWEILIHERLFRPLGLTAGFGPVGTPGKTDQPWPHGANGKPLPTNGVLSDNPPSMSPAGRVHGSLANYALFAADHLKGAAGKKAILEPESYQWLHKPPEGGEYAGGWIVAERPWGGGKVLTHTGSNNANFFVAWLAPAKGFGVIAATNMAGDAATKACDEACSFLIEQQSKA